MHIHCKLCEIGTLCALQIALLSYLMHSCCSPKLVKCLYGESSYRCNVPLRCIVACVGARGILLQSEDCGCVSCDRGEY